MNAVAGITLVSALLCSCGGSINSAQSLVVTNELLTKDCSPSVIYSPFQPFQEPIVQDKWKVNVRYQGDTKAVYDCSGEFSATIDSSKFPYQVIRGGGPHTFLSYEPSVPVPVFTKTLGLNISFDLKIPTVLVSSGNVVQFYTIVYFKNKNTSKLVAYVISVLDPRESELHNENVQSDTWVNFVSSRFLSTSKYTTLIQGSAESTTKPILTYAPYSVLISPNNFFAGLSEINTRFKLNDSTSPEDYELVLALVGAELAVTPEGVAKIDFSVKNINISQGVLK